MSDIELNEPGAPPTRPGVVTASPAPPPGPSPKTDFEQAVVAVYKSHADAEGAVRVLDHAGLPLKQTSIIGRNFELQENVQGYYQPGDAALEGAGAGAWVGGLFGLLWGFGFFLLPVAGPLFVLGPIAGLIAGAVGGAGVGALIGALTSLGISKEEALKYQARLQAGEFLVVVQGSAEQVARAREALQNTRQLEIQTHYTTPIAKAA